MITNSPRQVGFFVTNFLLQISCYKFFVTNLLLQIFCYKFIVTNFLLQIFCYKFFVTIFLLRIKHLLSTAAHRLVEYHNPTVNVKLFFSFVTIVFLLLFTTAHYGSGASALRAYVVPSALQSRYVMGGSCFADLSQLPASLRAGTRVRAVVRCP